MTHVEYPFEDILSAVNNSGADQVVLVGVTGDVLHCECRCSDAYSFGLTEIAFDFVGFEYIRAPRVMDYERLVVFSDLPGDLAAIAGPTPVFAFLTSAVESTDGHPPWV